MKKLKKVFVLLIAAIFIITLASCKKDESTRNTSTPMGSIDTSEIVAYLGNESDPTVSITKGLYYDSLRADGYDTVIKNIRKALFQEEIAFVKNQFASNEMNDYKQELYDAYASDVYQTTSGEALKELKDSEKETRVQKFIDTCANKNISIDASSIEYKIEGDKIQFTSVPEAIIEEKVLDIAIRKAAKDALKEIVDEEKIENDEGNMVTNNYYISDENIKSYYENNQKNYGTYQAIIIQFNTLAEAQKAMAYANRIYGDINDVNALAFYVALYNYYYRYRIQLKSNPFIDSSCADETNFVINEDKDELQEKSSAAKTILTSTFKDDGDGTYLSFPFNLNGKYMMVYRGETTYEINEKYGINSKEQLDWEDLKTHTTAYDAVYAEIKDELIDNKISSYTSTIINKRIKNSELKIYDPYYEYRFKNSNDENYDLIHKDDFDNNNIFKLTYDGKETTYSVDTFYEEMNKTVGFAKLVQLLKLGYVYDLKDQFLDDDKVEEYENDLNTVIDNFNNGENESYPKEIGEATFLLANYGYSNKEDILKYNKVASSVLSSYLSQTVFDEWATDEHALNTEKINVLNNLLAAGNKKYNDIFSIKIDHLLIYIDDDGDGSPDDPKKFLEKDIDVDDFNKEVLALSKAIYNETKCEKLTSANNTIMDILNRVVRNYYRDDALYSDPNDNWSNYKKYNLQLKVESLSSSGNTTDSNVSNYVKDFADYVEKLYQTVKADKLDTDDGDKPTFYFNYLESNTDKKQPLSIEEICATEFGYHLIIVDDFEETDSTEKTSSSDPNGYQKNIEILLNEKDEDDTEDNIYIVIPDTYNDKKTEATLNQFATYYLQSQKGITSSLDSSIRSLLSSMFDEAISRYTSRNFQEYLLFKDMGVHIKDSKLTTAQSNYEGYLKRVSQNYDKEDTLADWYTDAFNWKRPY